MAMRPLIFGFRVLVKIGAQWVEKIAIGHDDETDDIEVLRIGVTELPESGFTYFPPGAGRDVYKKGDWKRKDDESTSNPVEALQAEIARGEDQRKRTHPGKADEPRQGWTSLFTVVAGRLPRELRGGEEICYQCVRKYFDDPVPKSLQPARKVSSGRKCALCGAPLKPTS